LLSRTVKHGVGLPWIGFADGLAFPAAGVGYLSADRAGKYRTADGGYSWHTVLFSDDTYTVEDASWIDASTGYVLFFVRPALEVVDGMTWSNRSSSSPAGVSPVRVAARRPGSRLAARSGNGPGRSPASKALLGERLSGPQREAKPAAW
jgi:hypothetical protein